MANVRNFMSLKYQTHVNQGIMRKGALIPLKSHTQCILAHIVGVARESRRNRRIAVDPLLGSYRPAG
jgi:hypothetical protein